MWVKTYCSVEKLDISRVKCVQVSGSAVCVSFVDDYSKTYVFEDAEAAAHFVNELYTALRQQDESTEDQRQTGGSLSPVPWVKEVVKEPEDLGRIWHTGGYPQRINYCEARMVPA